MVDGNAMDRHVSVTDIRKWTLVAVALILFMYVQMASSAPCCGGFGSYSSKTSSFLSSLFSAASSFKISLKF